MTIFDVKKFLGSEASPENAGARLGGELLVLALHRQDVVLDVSRVAPELLSAELICTMLRVLQLAGQILGPGHLRLHWKASSSALVQDLDDLVRDLAGATSTHGTPTSRPK
jgi:hypothetical protein